MKIAIMQPYIFPYIGYFQLINAVDKFVFYDDVNYIKKGWINRNRILVNSDANLFTVPVLKASQNKLINQIELCIDAKWFRQFYSTLEHNYKNAPYYLETTDLIKAIFSQSCTTISDLAITSIKTISNHLSINTVFETSSELYSSTKGLEKANRLIAICKLNNAATYINPAGGKELYHKPYFEQQGIELFFIDNKIIPYNQFKHPFVGGLSLIDVLMFNSTEQLNGLINQYNLI